MGKTRQPLILAPLQHEAAAIRKAIEKDARIEVIGPRGAMMSRVKLGDANRIMLAGVAGALSPELKTGDVVLDESSTWDAPNVPYRRGRFHTAERIVATSQQKEELLRTTGAVVVDMESDVVRRFAAERRIAYLGIRAILDQADETLDPAVLALTDERGRVRPVRLAARLPVLLPSLLRLRRQSSLAMENLCDAIRAIIDANP